MSHMGQFLQDRVNGCFVSLIFLKVCRSPVWRNLLKRDEIVSIGDGPLQGSPFLKCVVFFWALYVEGQMGSGGWV